MVARDSPDRAPGHHPHSPMGFKKIMGRKRRNKSTLKWDVDRVGGGTCVISFERAHSRKTMREALISKAADFRNDSHRLATSQCVYLG